jgi:hypothetical protein
MVQHSHSLTIASVNTTRSISLAFNGLRAGFRDAPKGIENLYKEYNAVKGVLESLQNLVNKPDEDVEPDPEIVGQVRTVIVDTQQTLDELNASIKSLLPSKVGPSKRSTIQIRCRYLWNEKPIQATLLRLQARRDALSLIMNMWSR